MLWFKRKNRIAKKKIVLTTKNIKLIENKRNEGYSMDNNSPPDMTYTQLSLMDDLPTVIQNLMDKYRLKGTDVAEQAGITPTMFSRYLRHGISPRRSTFAELLKVLARTPQEEEILTAAYEGRDPNLGLPMGSTPYREQSDPLPVQIEEDARAYQRAKIEAVEFEKDIEDELTNANIPFIKHFHSEDYICDFVTKTKTRIGINCKSNVRVDWERSMGDSLLIKANLNISEFVLCVPYLNDMAKRFKEEFAKFGLHIVPHHELIPTLKRLGA